MHFQKCKNIFTFNIGIIFFLHFQGGARASPKYVVYWLSKRSRHVTVWLSQFGADAATAPMLGNAVPESTFPDMHIQVCLILLRGGCAAVIISHAKLSPEAFHIHYAYASRLFSVGHLLGVCVHAAIRSNWLWGTPPPNSPPVYDFFHSQCVTPLAPPEIFSAMSLLWHWVLDIFIYNFFVKLVELVRRLQTVNQNIRYVKSPPAHPYSHFRTCPLFQP